MVQFKPAFTDVLVSMTLDVLLWDIFFRDSMVQVKPVSTDALVFMTLEHL